LYELIVLTFLAVYREDGIGLVQQQILAALQKSAGGNSSPAPAAQVQQKVLCASLGW